MAPDTPDSKDVTVIMPAYRAAGTIRRALASIAAQTMTPGAVIVIDDGSDDGTTRQAEEARTQLEGTGTALIVLRQTNNGAGAARNVGLQASSTEFVAFLDADDEWLPEKLERTMAVLRSTCSVLAAHDYLRVDGGKTTLVACARRFNASHDPFVELYKRGYLATSTVVCRRDILLKAGGFDETLPTAQDFDLWLKALSPDSTPYVVFDEPLLRYHITGGSITSHTRRRLDCTLEIAVRHAPQLRARGGWLGPLLFRVLAVHGEALTAYWQQRRWKQVIGVAAKGAVNVLLAPIRAL